MEPLDLEAHGAQPHRARRHRRAAETLERLAVGPGERHGRVTADACREAMAFEYRQLRETPLDALVHVAEPLLEPQHLLADDREPEVAWLDDARVHGPHRHLVHAVTGDAHKR